MAMLTTGLVGSVQLFISLSTIVFIAHSYKDQLKGVSLDWSFCSEKTRRLLECVHNCIQHTDSRSLGYKNIATLCYRHTANTQNGSDTLLFGNLTAQPSGGGKKPLSPPTQIPIQHKQLVVLKGGRSTWDGVKQACNLTGLIQIASKIDQATAVAIVNGSGLRYVAIGVFRHGYKWVSVHSDELLYSDWAKGEPGFLEFFAGLSKRNGYKWKAFGSSRQFDGVLCGE